MIDIIATQRDFLTGRGLGMGDAGDIATAAGLDAEFTDAALDIVDLGVQAFGDGLYMESVCKPVVEAAPDEDRQAQVLAKLGRQGDTRQTLME